MADKSIIIHNRNKSQQDKYDAEQRKINKAQINYERDQEGNFEPADIQRRYYNRRGKFIRAINVVMKSKGKPPIDFKVYNDHEVQIQFMYSCLKFDTVKNSQLLYNFARHIYEWDAFRYYEDIDFREEYYAGLRPLRPLIFVSKDEDMFMNMYNETEDNWYYYSEHRVLYTMKERMLGNINSLEYTGYKRFYPAYCDYTERILSGAHTIQYAGDNDLGNPDYGKSHYVYKECTEDNEDSEDDEETEKITTTNLPDTITLEHK